MLTAKKVPLRTMNVRMPGASDPSEFSYSELFLAALGGPTRDGYTIEDIRKRVPVMDAIEKAVKAEADHLLLEKGQHSTLVQAFQRFRFTVVSSALLQMVDEVENAAEVELGEKDEEK